MTPPALEDLTWTAFTADGDASASMDPLLARLGALPDVVSPSPLPDPGEVLADNYEIIGPLAAGGMSSVMVARDMRLGRTVVIKLIMSRRSHLTAERLLLFEREARATAQLQHPNIVTIHAFGLWKGTPFMVLEHLRGCSLSEHLEREGALPPRRAVAIMTAVLAGLGHAHSIGIVHRDLKPANVFLEDSGRVVLLDFGIAELDRDRHELLDVLRDSGADHLIAPGPRFAGTPAYMAPEQLRGEEVDARADVWAVGVMFYQMLTGALPLKNVDEVLSAETAIPNLDREDVPAVLELWVSRALCRTASERPADGRTLLTTLEAAERRMHTARERQSRRRRRFLFSFFGLLILAGLASWGYHTARQDALRSARAEGEANERARKAEHARELAEVAEQRAIGELERHRAAELIGSARELLDDDPALALELARAAAQLSSTPAATEALRAALEAHHERLRVPGRALAVSPDGTLAVVERGEELSLLRLDSPDLTPIALPALGARTACFFTSDSQHIVAMDTEQIALLDRRGEVLSSETLKSGGGSPRPVIAPDTTRVLVFGQRPQLFAIEPPRLESLLVTEHGADYNRRMTAFSEDSQTLMLPRDDSPVAELYTRDGRLRARLRHDDVTDDGSAFNAQFSESGHRVVTRGGRYNRVWTLDGEVEHTHESPRRHAERGFLTRDGHFLVSHRFQLHHRALKERESPIRFAPDPIGRAELQDSTWTRTGEIHAFPERGPLLFYGLNRRVQFWSREGELVGITDAGPREPTFSREGQHVALWSDATQVDRDTPLRVYSRQGKLVLTVRVKGIVQSVDFTTGGDLVVVTRSQTHVYTLHDSTELPVNTDALLELAHQRSTHTLTAEEREHYGLEVQP